LTTGKSTVKGIEMTAVGDRGSSPAFDSTGSRSYGPKKLLGTSHIAVSVSVPSSVTSGKVTLTVYAHATGVSEFSAKKSFSVTKPKPKPKPSSSHSSTS